MMHKVQPAGQDKDPKDQVRLTAQGVFDTDPEREPVPRMCVEMQKGLREKGYF